MTDTGVHRTLQDSKYENTTLQQGYIAVTLHKSILLSYLPQQSGRLHLGATFFLLHYPGNLVAIEAPLPAGEAGGVGNGGPV
jgi:hypothetical protein